MKITENFKNKVKKAKKLGYTHVISVCSQCFTTVYYHVYPVKDILAAKTGISLSYGRYNGTHNPPTKSIKYLDCFKL